MDKDQRRGLEGHEICLAVSSEPEAERYLYTLGRHDAESEHRMALRDSQGFVIKSGEIETDSGHRFYALLELCAPDSHEHYGTGVVVPGLVRDHRGSGRMLLSKGSVQDPSGEDDSGPVAVGVVWQGEKDFEDWVRQAKAADPSFEFFPYRYLYYDEDAREDDHHVGPDGWSGR